MTSFAEQVGGVGAMILTHVTDFERETDNLRRLLDGAVSDQVRKVTAARDRLSVGGDELRKVAGSDRLAKANALNMALDDYREEMQRLSDLIDEMHVITDRRNAALPDFRRWALGQHAGAER